MGIKMLIKVACYVSVAGESLCVPYDVAETAEVNSKEDALYLARSGRAYFLDKANDPTKGLLTATKEEIEQVKERARVIAAARKEQDRDRYLQSPAGQLDALAEKMAKLMGVAQQAKLAAT